MSSGVAFVRRATGSPTKINGGRNVTRPPFKATHILKESIPQLRLRKGMPLRQINPMGDKERLCYTQEEWERNCRQPWILHPAQLEPLPDWEIQQRQMIDDICARR